MATLRTKAADLGASRATPSGGPSSAARANDALSGLSTSSRWARWEMDARKGDKRIGMLLRNYKQLEGELEGTRSALRKEAAAHDFAKDELRATRDALEDLKRSFEAAESLLNEGLEHKDALEDRLRAEHQAKARLEPEHAKLRAERDALKLEAETTKAKTKELLERVTKRDHRVAALEKRVAKEEKEKRLAEQARDRAEEDLLKVETRAGVLRKRVAALEAAAKNDAERRAGGDAATDAMEEELARLRTEIEVKEEECHMLAAMVSKTAAAANASQNGGSKGDDAGRRDGRRAGGRDARRSAGSGAKGGETADDATSESTTARHGRGAGSKTTRGAPPPTPEGIAGPGLGDLLGDLGASALPGGTAEEVYAELSRA